MCDRTSFRTSSTARALDRPSTAASSMRRVAVCAFLIYGVALTSACSGEDASEDNDQVASYEKFSAAFDKGADCRELFEIRSRMEPKDPCDRRRRCRASDFCSSLRAARLALALRSTWARLSVSRPAHVLPLGKSASGCASLAVLDQELDDRAMQRSVWGAGGRRASRRVTGGGQKIGRFRGTERLLAAGARSSPNVWDL